MTVYEFMEKMGNYEKFYISVAGKDITNDEAVSLHDIKMHYEERPQVLDALEHYSQEPWRHQVIDKNTY